MNEAKELDLIRKSKNDDSIAMEILLNKYRGMVIKESRKLYLIGADEEDLIQEGMIGLFKSIRDYDESANVDFPGFASICIKRQLASAVRRANRGKSKILNDALSIDATADDENGGSIMDYLDSDALSPEDKVIEMERIDMIWESIRNNLSDYEKSVLEFYLEGYKYDEIAKEVKKDAKSIDNAIQRIRSKLSVAIDE